MRVLHLRESDGEGVEIALHPQVTVVRGLDPTRRAWLIDVLGRLAGSDDPAAIGEVEAHGIRFALRRDDLALLDLDRPVAAVVRASDLPGHDPRAAEAAEARRKAETRRRELTDAITAQRSALGAAVTERDAATAALDEVRRGEGAARDAVVEAASVASRIEAELRAASEGRARQEDNLASAILARDMASEARTAAAERLESSRDQRRHAMATAMAAAAAVEEARSVAADDPTDRLAGARAQLAAAEGAAAEADPDRDGSKLNRQLADLERRRAELARLQEALGEGGSASVAGALDRLLGSSSEPQPVVAALALADTWRDLHQQIRALDAGISPEEHAAEERVAMARRTVVEAEADFNQPVLTPEQIAKVEAAHAAVLEAQDRTEGRFGGGRSRKKLDETRSEERRVLERLGFSTYADYMMSSSSRGVGPANRAILETAKGQLTSAQDDLAQLPGAADRARRRTELLQRRDAVAPRVAGLLGHEPTGPEAEDELRLLREAVAPDEAALAALGTELTKVGIMVGDAPYERDDLTLLARSYLAEQQASEDRRTEVREALDALDAAVVTLREARDRGAVDAPDLPPLPALAEPVALDADADADAEARAVTLREARWAEVESARTAVTDLEEAVAQHRRTNEQLVGLEADLDRATRSEEAAAAAVASAEADVALANGPAFDAAVTAAAEAEAALTRARAREDEARRRAADAGSSSGLDQVVAAAEARLSAAEGSVTSAAAAEQEIAAQLAGADADHAAAVGAESTAAAEAASVDRAALLDELDWELLSRLAALRSIGIGGSVPIVLDDPFAALDDDEVGRVLDRVAQLAGAVQVVLVSDRPAVRAWAERAGTERVALVAA